MEHSANPVIAKWNDFSTELLAYIVLPIISYISDLIFPDLLPFIFGKDVWPIATLVIYIILIRILTRLFPLWFYLDRMTYKHGLQATLVKFPEDESFYLLQKQVFHKVPDENTFKLLGFDPSKAQMYSNGFGKRHNTSRQGLESAKEWGIVVFEEKNPKRFFAKIGFSYTEIADIYTFKQLLSCNTAIQEEKFSFFTSDTIVSLGLIPKLDPFIYRNSTLDQPFTSNWISQKFQGSKIGWLRSRYKEFHVEGVIAKKLDQLLLLENSRKQCYDSVANIVLNQKNLILISIEFKKWLNSEETLSLDQSESLAMNNFIQGVIDFYKSSNDKYIKIQDCLLRDIELDPVDYTDIHSSTGLESLRSMVRPFLDKLWDYEEMAVHLREILRVPEICPEDIESLVIAHNLVIVGKPYSGKTHAVANYVENRISVEHPSLIIQASRAQVDSWTIILSLAMENCNYLVDTSILRELESIAAEIDKKREVFSKQYPSIYSSSTKVLVVVDGLDESSLKWQWKLRIDQLPLLFESCPRTRFVFTTRPSFLITNTLDWGVRLQCIELPSSGDVDLFILAQRYFEESNIILTDEFWIRNYLDSAMAVSLFAELNVGKTFTNLLDIDSTLVSLIDEKIDILENDLSNKPDGKLVANERFVRQFLAEIAELFSDNKPVSEREIWEQVKSSGGIGHLIADGHFLKFVLRELASAMVIDQVALPNNEIGWALPQQSVLDYSIANHISQNLELFKTNFPQRFRHNQGVLEMLAYRIFKETRRFIGEDGLWEDEFTLEEKTQMKSRVLARAPVSVIQAEEVNWIKDQFR